MKTQLLAALLAASSLTATAQAPDNALLYEVSGKGLAQPSYLYGTFHLVCPTDLNVTEATKKAIGNSQKMYLELDMDDPAMMQGMMKAMMMTNGKTAKDYLSADDYTLLDSYLKSKLKMSLTQVGTFKPIGLMSLMYMTMLPCQPASYDMTFAQMAGKDKKEVVGLETLEAQMGAMDNIPIEEQYKGLVDMVKKPEESQKKFGDMIAAYKAHDLARVMALVKESSTSGSSADFEEKILNERNQNWIPVIEKAASQQPTFFAFGAAHLGNEKGVVSLLRKQGYTVKAIE
jgi:uncharacterized protein